MMQTSSLAKAGEVIQVLPRLIPEPARREGGVLSNCEQAELTECEGIIERGLQAFMDVGEAMMHIRDKRLYRGRHQTFEEYCRVRWHYGKSYAYHLIAAAEVASHLSTIVDVPKPTRESQVRPLVGLKGDQAIRAWRKAAEAAEGKPITARLVRESLDDIVPSKDKSRRAKPGRRSTTSQGQRAILTLIDETAALVREMPDGVVVLAQLNQIRRQVSALLKASTR